VRERIRLAEQKKATRPLIGPVCLMTFQNATSVCRGQRMRFDIYDIRA